MRHWHLYFVSTTQAILKIKPSYFNPFQIFHTLHVVEHGMCDIIWSVRFKSPYMDQYRCCATRMRIVVSHSTRDKVFEEIKKILDEADKRAQEILLANKISSNWYVGTKIYFFSYYCNPWIQFWCFWLDCQQIDYERYDRSGCVGEVFGTISIYRYGKTDGIRWGFSISWFETMEFRKHNKYGIQYITKYSFVILF